MFDSQTPSLAEPFTQETIVLTSDSMSTPSHEVGDPNRIEGIRHARPTQASREVEDGSGAVRESAVQVVVPQDPSTVVVAPEDIDTSVGERASSTAKRVEPANDAAEQGEFPQPVSSPSSLEKAAGHLRQCRLVLMYGVPVFHPIWSRVRIDGTLGEDEPEPDSDEMVEVGESAEDSSSGGVPAEEEAGDWWDEMDEALAQKASDEEPVVSPMEEGANVSSQDEDAQDVSSEEE